LSSDLTDLLVYVKDVVLVISRAKARIDDDLFDRRNLVLISVTELFYKLRDDFFGVLCFKCWYLHRS
jgi:hypothetical protein